MQVISLADRWHNEGLAARERREQQRLDLEAELALSLEGYVNLSSQTYAYPGRSYSPRTLSSAAQFDERHIRNASLARKTIVELDVHPTWRDLDERFKGEVKTVRDNRFGAANPKNLNGPSGGPMVRTVDSEKRQPLLRERVSQKKFEW